MLISQLYIFFREISLQILCAFLNWAIYPFMIELYSFVGVYTAFSFICLFVSGYLVCFHTLPLLQQTWEYRYLLRIVIWINARECNCWVMWLYYFYFLKHLHTVFHSSCIDLRPCSVCMGSLFSHSHQHTFLVFLVIGFLTGV